MGWRSLDYSDATRMRSATRKLNVRFVGACRSSNVFCRPAPPVKYPRYDSDLLKVGSLLVGMPEPETLDPAQRRASLRLDCLIQWDTNPGPCVFSSGQGRGPPTPRHWRLALAGSAFAGYWRLGTVQEPP